jgi:cytochrome c5
MRVVPGSGRGKRLNLSLCLECHSSPAAGESAGGDASLWPPEHAQEKRSNVASYLISELLSY